MTDADNEIDPDEENGIDTKLVMRPTTFQKRSIRGSLSSY